MPQSIFSFSFKQKTHLLTAIKRSAMYLFPSLLKQATKQHTATKQPTSNKATMTKEYKKVSFGTVSVYDLTDTGIKALPIVMPITFAVGQKSPLLTHHHIAVITYDPMFTARPAIYNNRRVQIKKDKCDLSQPLTPIMEDNKQDIFFAGDDLLLRFMLTKAL